MTAFGVNAIVLPPGYATDRHFHERQEELYLVIEGEIEFKLRRRATRHARPRRLRARRRRRRSARCATSRPDAEADYVCVGGAGGYVGRDGVLPDEPLERCAASRSRISVSSRTSSADGLGAGVLARPRRAASMFSGWTTKK